MSKKLRVGTVTSIEGNKTLMVTVQIKYQHSKYFKIMTKIKKYLVHDSNNICYIGDKILMEETRPISSKKCWILKSIYN
jgi:small subunit ribosomal protein S17